MIIELSRSFLTFDACMCYLSSIGLTFLLKIDKMFYSKQSQGPVAVSLTPGRPTEEANNRRVKVRILFVHTSFTFVNPSLFSATILADIWDTEVENYSKRFVFHVS